MSKGIPTMLIIDPEQQGARVYTEEYVGYILGTPKEVCVELAHRLFALQDNTLVQTIVPSVDSAGFGQAYIDCLGYMGITVKEIKYMPYDMFLPRTC